jgi:arsenite methyltransferase
MSHRPAPRRGLAAAALFTGAALLAASTGLGGCTAFKRLAYDGFDRDAWQQPDRVVAVLRLHPGDRVADLGAGGGYFTFRLARAVGPTGRVYAVDVDDGLLAYLRERAEKDQLPQIETVRASEDDSNLPPASIDLIFVCDTFHHLPDPPAYFARLRDRLRPDGRVAIVELSHGSFPPGHETARSTIVEDLEHAGYTRVASYDFLDRQSFQVFTPAEATR